MIKFLKNIKDCYKHVPYTWNHYLAFMKVQKYVFGYYKYKFHDWDKLMMYIFLPFINIKKISKIHQKINKHHPIYFKNKEKILKKSDKVNWEEAIIDWECARYTKPDKPLNARDTLYKFYPEYISIVEPILRKYNL